VPKEFSQESLEWGQWLFAQECTFIRGVPTLIDLPNFGLNEIAFIGRSNVGKSSLINTVTGRTTLARVSHTPGRTQHLNFFNLANRLILVDMPGYGYAKAAKSAIKQWTTLIKQYLKGRPTLARVYVLIDSRHGLKDNDLELMKMLDESAVSYQIILTKIDKVSRKPLQDLHLKIEQQLKSHPAAYPTIILTSSDEKKGIAELRAEIAQFALGSPQQV
jgi:GTP-binding protein